MDEKITILIADDKKAARERLKKILLTFDCHICGEAVNTDEVISKIITLQPSLLFLDINMPGINVFELIKSLKTPPLIIFQTAYSQYAVDAFGVNAVDYLLKPYSEERVKIAIEKATKVIEMSKFRLNQKEEIKNYTKYISVRNGNSIQFIDIKDIIRICFEDGFAFVYIKETRYLTDKSLNDFEAILNPELFFRTSRNDIIKLSEISKIHPMFNGNYLIEMKDKISVPLSRRRARELRVILNF